MDPILLAAGTGHAVAFYAMAALAVASAVLMMTQRNPVACVLWLVVCFIGLAGLFVTLEAYFLAVIQVLVYAGAIMVLFLFVIMLLNLRREDMQQVSLPRIPLVGVVAALLLLAAVVSVISASRPWFGMSVAGILAEIGPTKDSVREIGLPLFRDWLLPFEVTSILLLVAIVGAVALTKRKV
jgi:NADH-quinone oxidoreductase subunit J